MLKTLVAVAAAALMAVPALASARMTIVYDDIGPASTLFTSPGGLGEADGAFRQEEGSGGVFRPDGASFRIAKVNRRELEGLSAEQIAEVLRREIDAPDEAEAGSHLVAVDEIGNHYRDDPARTEFKTVLVRGKRYRIAKHNDIRVTRNGWQLVRRQAPAPEPQPGDPGVVLSEAMEILDGQESPWGGTYASRVHFYLAPSLVTSIGEGRGEHFTLGRSGSTHIRPGWRGVFPGLARGGGVWLQMYHGAGYAVNARVWQNAPGRIANYLTRFGGSPDRVHLVFTESATPPAGSPAGCGSPMSCMWTLAKGGTTAAVLANGPGVYQVDGEAAEWLREYRAYFG